MKKRYLISLLIIGAFAIRLYYPVVEDYFEEKSCAIGSVGKEQYAKILEDTEAYVSSALITHIFHPRYPAQSSYLLKQSMKELIPEEAPADVKLSYIHAIMTAYGGRLVLANRDQRVWGNNKVVYRDPRDFKYLFASGKFSLIGFGVDIFHLLVFAPIDYTLFYQSLLRFNENPAAYRTHMDKKFLKVGKHYLVEPFFGSPAGGPKESTSRIRQSIGCPTMAMLGEVGEDE